LAERVCVFAPDPDGWALQSDVTTSPVKAWRGGQTTRLMASVLRASRGFGEPAVFEASGPALWTRLRRQLEALLLDYWRAGGLGGASAEEAFQVRCDRSTMSQNDLDAGRVIAQVTLLPVAAVDRITVSMVLGAAERTDLALAAVA
jgi:phage tail sheath protein FI